MWSTLDGKPPLIIAHRGASGYRPEHTLAAYALAVDMGADIVEPDLVFSKDGVLVARHDRYLSTTTDVADHPEFADRKRANDDPDDAPREDWWVEDFTLAELKTLRARQPFPGRSTEYDGLYEIPTFDEMLALVARKSKDTGRPVGIYPETKRPGFYASKGYDFEAPLLKALAGFDAGPIFIQSFEPEILKRLKGKTDAKLVQLVFAVRSSELVGLPEPNLSPIQFAVYADGTGVEKILCDDRLSVNKDQLNSSFVHSAHKLGLFVHAWTYRNDQPALPVTEFFDTRSLIRPLRIAPSDNASTELAIALTLGVDGVFTDFPDTAVKVRDAMLSPQQK